MDLILCTAPAHVHRNIARDLAPHLKSSQSVVLNPGRTCGALEFANVLRENEGPEEVAVVEAQTLLYACRRQGAAVHVFGVKDLRNCTGFIVRSTYSGS